MRWLNLKAEKRLIEEWLPLPEVNFDGIIEMAFKALNKRVSHGGFKKAYGFDPRVVNTRAPRLRNLHLWLARRPCGVSRVLTLSSLLPAGTDKTVFKELVGLDVTPSLINKKLPPVMFYVSPQRTGIEEKVLGTHHKSSDEIIVLDPMAGGGSIPFEALRLGFRSLSIDYNPVAYIVLKATIEYPSKFGNNMKLYEDVKEEAKALIKYSVKELMQYYTPNAENYIIARGVICPNVECQGLIPIIHSTRLGKDGPYIKFNFDKKAKTFRVNVVDSETTFEKLRCPFCGRPLTQDEVFRSWVVKHGRLLETALSGDVDEAKNNVNKLLVTHVPLIKQVPGGFSPCNEVDKQVLIKAYLDLAEQVEELNKYIPHAPIPEENEVFGPVKTRGISKWYELFSPRQLLILSKLIKYVVERAEVLIDEKGEYGAAVATYLALGLDKVTNYNSILSTWHSTHSVIRDLTGQYATGRKIGFGLEYCEAKRIDLALDWVYEPNVERPTATTGGICPILRELCGGVAGFGDKVEVYMGDARELARILGDRGTDIVNVDPPYFAQHTYSDLSEFFWQLLRVSLRPVINSGYLFNRDEGKGRVECLVNGWNPVLPTVPRNGEIIVRKKRSKLEQAYQPNTRGWYTEQMWKFFTEVHKILKDEGILIVWFTHSDPEAWESILSGLYASDSVVSRAWTVTTEMEQRRVAHTGSAFFTSMALVARKGGSNGIIVGERDPEKLVSDQHVEKSILESVNEAFQSANISKASAMETFIMALAGAIAGATKIRNPSIETVHITKQNVLTKETNVEEEIAKQRFYALSRFFRESLYPVALYIGTSRILEDELQKAGLQQDKIKLVVGSDNYSRAYLAFWISSRYSEESNVNYDFSEKICKVVGVTVDGLKNFGLLDKVEKDVYQVLFGREIIDAVRNRVETLDRTSVGQSMYTFKLIVDSPIRDDPERCARQVLTIKPVSRQVIATALFLLRTAKEDELRKASISLLNKPYVEKVLESLYSR